MNEPHEALAQTDQGEEESSAVHLPWKSIAWAALLAMVFVVPLATGNFTWLGYPRPATYDMFATVKVLLLRLGLLAGIAAWGWHLVSDEDARLRRTPVDRAILLFLGWLVVTTAFSIHLPTAVFGEYTRNGGLLTFVLYAGVFFLTVQLSDKITHVRQFARVLFWAGVMVSAYGVAQYLGFDPVRWPEAIFAGRTFSTYGNPEILGNFLVFFIPVSGALALAETRRPWRVVWLSGALIGVVALLVTFTRGAWVGGAVALAVLTFIAWRQRASLDRVVDTAFAALSATVVGLVVWTSARTGDAVTSVPSRLASIFQYETGSVQTRIQVYRSALEAIADRPVFGFGLDTFRLLFPAYKTERFVAAAEYMGVADQAHSYPLQLAATIGIPGLLLFGIIVGGVAIRSGRILFAKNTGESSAASTRILLGGLWAACAGYLASLAVGISQPETTFLLWMGMAMLAAPLATTRRMPLVLRRSTAASALSLICAVAVVGAAVAAFADNQYLYGRLLPNGSQRTATADAAVSLAPYNHVYQTYRGAAHAELALSEIGRARISGLDLTDAMRADFDRAVRHLQAALDLCPWERDNYAFLATVHNFGGRHVDADHYDDALRIAERGIDRIPYDAMLRYERSVALRALGRTEQARSELEKALRLEPRYGEAAVMLADIYVERGDRGRALTLLEESEQVAVNRTAVTEAIRSINASLPIETGR